MGGCLTIIIIIGLVIIGGIWWTAHKVKQEINKAQPKLEEWSKNADQWQKQSEELQKKAQNLQDSLPDNPNDFNTNSGN